MLNIEFKNNPTAKFEGMISKYWLIEQEKFKYQLHEIGYNIYSILNTYGQVTFNIDCSICKSEIKKIRLHRRNDFDLNLLKEKNNICDECKNIQNSTTKSTVEMDSITNNLFFSFDDTQNSKSDIMIPDKDIILKAGEKYLIKAWNQADGRFNISISDEKSLMNQKKQIDEELDFLKKSE